MRCARWLLVGSLVVAAVAAPSSEAKDGAGVDRSRITIHVDGPELDPLLPLDYEVDARAPWSPEDYDGAVFSEDAPDLTELPTVHAVYVLPSDAPSRFGELAAMFQADARQASQLLRTLYGRGVRLDERTGAGGARFVDITVLVSRYPTAVLSLPYVQFWLVEDELDRVGLHDPDKKYAVWLDAPSYACGQASLSQDGRRDPHNENEASSVAIVYRNYARSPGFGTGDLEGGGFCRGRTLLHELGHAFGAIQDEAPNNFDGAHCDDSVEDVMCYKQATLFNDTGGPAFDHGNDDYWDPAANPHSASDAELPWWTVNLSRFVCPPAGCDHPNVLEGR